MTAADRTCSECGVSIADRGLLAKTCGPAHQKARQRRQKNEARQAAGESLMRLESKEHQSIPQSVVKRAVEDEVHRLIRPVVRQALTEDVLKAVENLVNLTPFAVAAIEEDLKGSDPKLRQAAYSLLMKYTVGHQALVRPEDTEDNSQIVVNFNLPRPDAPKATPIEDDEAVLVLKTCDVCDKEKFADQFASGSDRCIECFEERKAAIIAQYT